MKRGEIWTAAGGADYSGKPRPVVIVQDERFDATRSITICAFTTTDIDAQDARVSIAPSATNGLKEHSSLMVDKITTIPRAKLGYLIGQLDRHDLDRVNRVLLVFLGLGA